MKPNRLLLVAAAGITLLASVGATVGTADAASSTSYSKRVCAHAATGYAACDAHVRTNGNLKPLATTSYQSGFSPAQLKTAYGLTGLDGSTTVAIVDAYANPNAKDDLNAYRSQFGLGTANLTQYNQNGGLSPLASADVGWGQEEMLDLEMVSAICTSCPIIYVGANSASFNDLAAAVRTAYAKGAKVISNSYGGKEFSTETSLTSSYAFSDATVLASTGDSGYGAQAPAAFSSVVAVGGTHLVLNGSTRTETVWSGAGSGCSAYIAKPSWQSDAACGRRTIGDVAAVADPATGVAVYDSYGSTGGANWYVFGGTSVAAPLIGGVYGLSGFGSSSAAKSLYTNRGALYDVTSGSNGRCVKGRNTAGAYLCTGVVGYDGPTGNGTPKGNLAPFQPVTP
jgi:subtilase family serine protease